MPRFDAEQYLRRLGERQLAVLLAQRGERDELPDAAAALTAVGALDAERARQIVVDYAVAMDRARSVNHPGAHRIIGDSELAPGVEPAPLPARRVFLLGVTVPLAGGELYLRTLTLTRENARLEGYVLWDPGGPGWGSGAPILDVRDATAGPVVPAVSPAVGARGQGHADGVWETEGPLAADLGWIEVSGTGIELFDPITPPAVEIEALPPERGPWRYLWHLLAHLQHHHDGGRVRAAVDALISAGRIRADDRELDGVLWVAEATGGPGWVQLRGGGTASPPSPAPAVPASVPARWRSLVRRQSPFTGTNGTLTVGAVTPPFDGVSIALNTLRAGPDRCWLTVDGAGALRPSPLAPGTLAHAPAWWASDDRYNHYLGHVENWSSDPTTGRGAGEVHFGALDARASELTLAVTTLSARALIAIPLIWDE
jgi:hypothetical protein